MILHWKNDGKCFERSIKKELLKREGFLMPGLPDHGVFWGEHLIPASDIEGILLGTWYEIEALCCVKCRVSRCKVCGGEGREGVKNLALDVRDTRS